MCARRMNLSIISNFTEKHDRRSVHVRIELSDLKSFSSSIGNMKFLDLKVRRIPAINEISDNPSTWKSISHISRFRRNCDYHDE